MRLQRSLHVNPMVLVLLMLPHRGSRRRVGSRWRQKRGEPCRECEAGGGYLKPRHAAGTHAVAPRCYRYQSGRWVLSKSVKVMVSNYANYARTTRSTRARLSLPCPGKWRIRGYHSESGHPAGYDAHDYITVRWPA
jgi:hypothetical protein